MPTYLVGKHHELRFAHNNIIHTPQSTTQYQALTLTLSYKSTPPSLNQPTERNKQTNSPRPSPISTNQTKDYLAYLAARVETPPSPLFLAPYNTCTYTTKNGYMTTLETDRSSRIHTLYIPHIHYTTVTPYLADVRLLPKCPRAWGPKGPGGKCSYVKSHVLALSLSLSLPLFLSHSPFNFHEPYLFVPFLSPPLSFTFPSLFLPLSSVSLSLPTSLSRLVPFPCPLSFFPFPFSSRRHPSATRTTYNPLGRVPSPSPTPHHAPRDISF